MPAFRDDISTEAYFPVKQLRLLNFDAARASLIHLLHISQ